MSPQTPTPSGNATTEASEIPEHVSVVVPTFDRPLDLDRCLTGLRAQTRRPDQVVVVVRPQDGVSLSLAQSWGDELPISVAEVERPGLVQALNAGLAAATGDVVAFVDDDAVPRREWVARIIAAYAADGAVAGVGGRDVVHLDGRVDEGPNRRWRRRPDDPTVGRVLWFGKVVGNHHLGTGGPRDVDILKGANMSFRSDAIPARGFDERVAGPGSQVHNELSVCLPIRRSGFRLIYDPAITVDHYPAQRQHGDDRGSMDVVTVESIAHNETLSVLPYLNPRQRPVYAAWAVFVGTGTSPGIIQIPRLWRRNGRGCFRLVAATFRGRWRAGRAIVRRS